MNKTKSWMSETAAIQDTIRQKLNASQHTLLLSHVRPDGDAIGSLIGFGLALQDAGKKASLYLEDGLPAKYRFLQGSQLVSKSLPEERDLVIALDCSDQRRLGKISPEIDIDINIDHHITNEQFAQVNLVLPEMPATAAILAECFPVWDLSITPAVASALLMGILTDTIGFRTSNVTPALLRTSADLMQAGADLGDIYNRVLISQSYPASLLWGYALSRLQKEDGIIWTVITLEDRKSAGYTGRDDADLTNLLSAIEGGEISILFNEQNDGKVKVSWRSNTQIDVSRIAQMFGGGGHPPAAGADITGSLDEVRKMVLKKTKSVIKDFNSKGAKKNE